MGPGYFSRACYGLAPSCSGEHLGAWLNDGWTVGAAPRVVALVQVFIRATDPGCKPVTRDQYPTPPDGNRRDAAGGSCGS